MFRRDNVQAELISYPFSLSVFVVFCISSAFNLLSLAYSLHTLGFAFTCLLLILQLVFV